MRRFWLFGVLVACGGSESPARDAASADGASVDGADGASLDHTPTTYRGTCDGSGALALSFVDVFTHAW